MITRAGPLITESDLAQFENTRNISLPEDYREFLMRNNGGTPAPNGFKYLKHNKSSESNLAHFYNLAELRPCTENAIGLLEIANDFFGNKLFLRILGHNRGEIVFWESEEELSEKALSYVSPNFTSFITSFYEISIPPETFNHPELLFIEYDINGINTYIDAKADLNALTECGLSLTLLAIKWQRYEILETLLKRGASGREALACAARGDDLEAVKRILNLGFNANEGNQKEPPIVRAAALRNMDMIKLLIKHNADINAEDGRGWNALRWAIINDDFKLIEFLKTSGAIE